MTEPVPSKPALGEGQPFLPGLLLSERYFHEAARPILDAHLPALGYAAGLIGYGSDVQGFDTPLSMDHEWGPRLLLFLAEPEFETLAPQVDQVLRDHLPVTFLGHSTNFGGATPEDPVERQEFRTTGPVKHKVWIQTVPRFLQHSLGVAAVDGLSWHDWLRFPEQRLREVTGGKVFHDGPGELTAVRDALREYPRDIRLHRLASHWTAISQEEAFVGRCGDVGDDLGSRLVAGRLATAMMKIALTLDRQYAPYSKWLGTAFARLPSAARLQPLLEEAMKAEHWKERETALVATASGLIEWQNELQLTEQLDPAPRPYFGRPYTVIGADRVAAALRKQITDAELRALPPTAQEK